jgi:hypothetical protein
VVGFGHDDLTTAVNGPAGEAWIDTVRQLMFELLFGVPLEVNLVIQRCAALCRLRHGLAPDWCAFM